ncbi:hypothetical protein SDC9_177685 [bioreactor metagenome]|uniref:Uncharacterized protein n=1 Tax=bioreactor metagenome TaxID=1076179 RepID=A0A645GW07_9ZZZZ
MASEKKNQGISPQENHNIKGTPSVGDPAFRPNSNTIQYTISVTNGCINAHMIPKYDPAYLVLKSFFERFQIKVLLLYSSCTRVRTLFDFFVTKYSKISTVKHSAIFKAKLALPLEFNRLAIFLSDIMYIINGSSPDVVIYNFSFSDLRLLIWLVSRSSL